MKAKQTEKFPRSRSCYSLCGDHRNDRQGSLGAGGQALVEYILVLVVVIAIASLFLIKLIKPLDAYLRSSLGSYVQCLLETGELPLLGTEEESAVGECGSLIMAARGDFKNSIAGQKGQSSSGSTSDSASSKGKEKSGGDKANKDSAASGTYAGSQSRGGGRQIRGGRGASEGQEGENADEGKKSDGSGGKFFRSRGVVETINTNREKVTAVDSNRFPEYLRRNTETSAKIQVLPELIGDGTAGSGPKRIPARQPDLKPSPTPELGEWEFGNYFRYILIAVIVIVILLLVGGQMYSLSKEQ